MTLTARPADPRALLADLYWAAVAAAAPGPALRAALSKPGLNLNRPIHIIALGKAGLPMAGAAVAVLDERGIARARSDIGRRCALALTPDLLVTVEVDGPGAPSTIRACPT